MISWAQRIGTNGWEVCLRNLLKHEMSTCSTLASINRSPFLEEMKLLFKKRETWSYLWTRTPRNTKSQEMNRFYLTLFALVLCLSVASSAIIEDAAGTFSVYPRYTGTLSHWRSLKDLILNFDNFWVSFKGCLASDDYTGDSKDCAKFYRCAFGYQTSFRCPQGTNFDRYMKFCNFLEHVKCY